MQQCCITYIKKRKNFINLCVSYALKGLTASAQKLILLRHEWRSHMFRNGTDAVVPLRLALYLISSTI